MTDRPTKIGILYWGQRGGGNFLTDQLIQTALDHEYQVSVYLRPIDRTDNPTPIKAYQCLRWLSARRSVLKEVQAAELEVIILPMASPWDLFMGRAFSRNGIRVIRMIHDASPHPGEKFPPRFWIKLLCQDSNQIVTFSNYVASKLVQQGYTPLNKIKVGELPSLDIGRNSLPSSEVPRKSFLFIGRGKKYKGLKQLLEAWPSVGDADSILTIAGEGHQVPPNLPRVRHIDHWLGDDEVLELVRNAEVVVLPYLEASQSGIIPIALSLGRPVVITPVGGLEEQIEVNINGLVASKVDAPALAEALNAARVYNFDLRYPRHGDESSFRLLKLCVANE
jgi:glycosyltransferase involved in cell wall biosynthesis